MEGSGSGSTTLIKYRGWKKELWVPLKPCFEFIYLGKIMIKNEGNAKCKFITILSI
jgi:hypothetical protein